MKTKLGGLIVLVALSSAVIMLGTTKYAPPPQPEPAVTAPAARQDREDSPTPKRERVEVKPAERPDAGVEARPEARPQAANGVTLYVPKAMGNDLQLVPVRQILGNEPTPLAALKALAAYDGPEEPALPKGTKVLGVRLGTSGLAVADFSRELVDNFPGGSQTEQLLLASIVNTLTQFRSVRRVVITVEGKSVDSIGGHIDLEEPLTRDMSLVVQNG